MDCQPSAVSLAGGDLFAAAPQVGSRGLNSSYRGNMTVVRSTDSGRSFGDPSVVFAGPSMYSSLADGLDGSILLFFERQGNASGIL